MHKISGDGTTVETTHSDPDYAPNVEVFDHLTYDEIHRGVMALKPEVLTAGRQTWQSSGSAMSDAVQQAHAEIRAAIADGWRGSAAQLAANAVQAFESLGQNLADVMSEVGHRLGQANDAAETLRSSVSHPASAAMDLDAALLDPKHAAANAETQKTTENVRLDVVRVMNSVYVGAFIPTGNNVPGFPVGGMYPTQQQTTPQPGVTAPGTSVDTASPTTSHGPNSNLAGTQSDPTIHQPSQQQAAQPDQARTDAAAAVTPASVTAPATAPAAATTPAAVHPASTATPVNTVAPQADRAAPVTSAPASAVASAPAAATPRGTSTKPQNTSTKPQSTDGDGKRKDQSDGSTSGDGSGGGDVSSGMGAGIVGGLAGGAFAMGDATRPGNTVPAPPRRSPEDEYEDDEDYYPEFDDPTFLEPAEPGTELVGHLDPTTPPVVGEWVDDEE
ncbi:WXG100 family type VII secretion target [Nocardia sp. CA2R105]|uniref:WXG100 family type VII secretion target n=1 Tax=Nocardia coffeae TaxID=2873381 RepID=UPI001CA6C9AD|nr:WXG100 family type VII secretion target [Nocardia coffeae]MBY8862557.1 WXG100 family type VII secretion target [Nocardia coffeae]